MELKAPRNKNYCATVVQIQHLIDLHNCDNVCGTIIFGNHVIVGIDTKIGDIGLFFPVETALDGVFLMKNNLYRDGILNSNPEKKGYFETHGRIKCVKFRGHKSEGFFVPLSFLGYLVGPNEDWNCEADGIVLGAEFDTIGEREICHKYIPKMNVASTVTKTNKRKPKPSDNIVENQFKFHIDTDNLRRNIHRISPDDIISITDKWHGTSGIVGNLLVKRNLSWFERLLRFAGVPVQETKYDIIHSSRRVVKGVGDQEKDGIHFYGNNLWGVVAKEIADRIPKSYTVYFEIVGYTPEGKQIQKDYTYQCEMNTHKVLVYRVTVTNEDGKVLELDYPQRIAFCAKYGFDTVKELFYGKANQLVPCNEPVLDLFDEWQAKFLAHLETTYMSRECYFNPGMPAEGIVVRREALLDECDAFKLKSFEFLSHESKQLDSGEIDMETLEDELDVATSVKNIGDQESIRRFV